MRTTPTRRFLITMWEGGGTVPPELGVARRLIARGHHVHVLADPTIGDEARAAGCGFTPWQRAPHRTLLDDPSEDLMKDWETSNPLVMLKRVRDRFIAGPAADFAADTADAIAEVGPDALITDSMIFGSMIAGEAAGLPVAAVVPNIWMFPTKGTPAIGPGFPPAKTALGRGRDTAMLTIVNRLFKGGLPALNAARAAHGLDPLTSFYDQVLDVDRILVLSNSEFDFAAPFVPKNVRYVGPVLDEPGWAEPWTNPWPESNQDPLVLVGFSTTYQQQGPLVQRVVDALSSLPVRAVVTLGQMLDASEVTAADNVVVVRSAPHRQILEQASLAVSHCGHGTTLKALAAGVPMVCIPMGRDQNDTAARVVHHGAGVRLSPKASTEKIRTAISTVLGDDCYRRNAARLATAINDDCASSGLVEQLEEVARSHAGVAN
jgi:MGT family glycosyltransferase